MPVEDLIRGAVAFEWDRGNIEKNWEKHKVKPSECEDVFFNEPLIIPDVGHSKKEPRYLASGQTDEGRTLFIAFTWRGEKIRVISARDANRKERRAYYEKIKKDPEIQE